MPNKEYWFKCPRCCHTGMVDDDQAHGRVSIQCVTEGCAFHETGNVSPLVESSDRLTPDIRFTLTP